MSAAHPQSPAHRGYTQVYTGNGKGKTTAALGLALRAWGAGLRVYLGQFLKHAETSEILALRRLDPPVAVELYGDTRHHVGDALSDEDRRAASTGLARGARACASGLYDMVILDEVNVALRYGLVRKDDLLELMASKSDRVELILTGRHAPKEVIERADLVTEMTDVKHYYRQGVTARTGIEL